MFKKFSFKALYSVLRRLKDKSWHNYHASSSPSDVGCSSHITHRHVSLTEIGISDIYFRVRVENIYEALIDNNVVVFFEGKYDFLIAKTITKKHNIKSTMVVFSGDGLVQTFFSLLDEIYEHSRDY